MKATYQTTLNGNTVTASSDRTPAPFALIYHGRDAAVVPRVASLHIRADLVEKEIARWRAIDPSEGVRLTVGTNVAY